MEDKVTQEPKWFDISKYDSLVDLTPGEWASLLNRRSRLLNVYHRNALRKFSPELNVEEFEKIKQDPIADDWGKPKAVQNFTWRYLIDNTPEAYADLYQDYAMPLTYSRAHSIARGLQTEAINAMESLDRDGYDEDTYEVYSKYKDLPINYYEVETGLDTGAVVDVSINLFATDEQIVESLQHYLAAARKFYKYPEGGKITATITKKLVQNCVLPYLDLKIWAMLENKRISQHIIGDWLFSKDLLNVAEKIRNTTIPLANRAVTQSFIETLAEM